MRLLDADLTWQEPTALYGACRFVLGARVHSAVLAVLGGAATFPLEVQATKAADLFAGTPVAGNVIDLRMTSPAAAAALVQQVLTSADGGLGASRATQEALREGAGAAIGLLAAVVGRELNRPAAPTAGSGRRASGSGETIRGAAAR